MTPPGTSLSQPDGKIVVAGDTTSSSNAMVWRYTPEGLPDPDFNGGAPLSIDSGGSETVFEIAFAPDNKIVVGGLTTNNSDGAIYRINTDGTLDTVGFGGGDGKLEVGLPAGFVQINGVAVQPDNKIVAIGQAGSVGNAIVWRFEPSGGPDLSFDDDGIQEVDTGGTETGQSVAIAPDGGIIGTGNVGGNGIVFRLNSMDGQLDTTGFSPPDGIHPLDSGGAEQVLGMQLQPDGKIVVVGLTSVGTDGTIYRVNPDGSPDNGFDNDGAFGLDSGGMEQAQDVAVQPDGKLVVVGTTSANSSAAIYRVNATGGLDSTFDGDGALGIDQGGTTDNALGVALQGDRKILVAGFTNVVGVSGYVARVLGDDPVVTPPTPPQQAKKKKCKKKKKKEGARPRRRSARRRKKEEEVAPG